MLSPLTSVIYEIQTQWSFPASRFSLRQTPCGSHTCFPTFWFQNKFQALYKAIPAHNVCLLPTTVTSFLLNTPLYLLYVGVLIPARSQTLEGMDYVKYFWNPITCAPWMPADRCLISFFNMQNLKEGESAMLAYWTKPQNQSGKGQ